MSIVPDKSAIQFQGRPVESVYLAGKITQTDWRDLIAPGWSYENHSPFPYAQGFEVPMHDATSWGIAPCCISVGGYAALDMTGPFWVNLAGGHGTVGGAIGIHANGEYCQHGTEVTDQSKVLGRIRKAIEAADLLFAWIDDVDCHGTLVEIGLASGLGKPVIVASPPRIHDDRELWLVHQIADVAIQALNAGAAWDTLCNRWFKLP